MRDAESTLDQLISFCGREITEPDVLSMFGLASQSQILALAGAVLAGETETALRELNDLAQQGKDIGRLVSELLGHFRNLLIFQVSRGDLSLIEASEAEGAALKEQAARIAKRCVDTNDGSADRLRRPPARHDFQENPGRSDAAENDRGPPCGQHRYRFEASAAIAGGSRDRRAARRRTEATRAYSASQGRARPARRRHRLPRQHRPAMRICEQLWAGLVEAVGRASPFVRTYFTEAHPVSLAKNVLTIGFNAEDAAHIPLVDNSKNHTLIQTKLAELGHPQVQVKFIQAEAPPNWKNAPRRDARAALRPRRRPRTRQKRNPRRLTRTISRTIP